MRVIYRLMDDKAYIEKVQKATLTTEQFGVNPTHGLFGSAEWWEKILSGGLPVYTYRGSITKRYMGSMNDWPEFTMRTDTREESSWTRYGNSPDSDRAYQVGRRIEVDYVLQRSRAKSFDPDAERKVVVEIRIEVPSETLRQSIARSRVSGQKF